MEQKYVNQWWLQKSAPFVVHNKKEGSGIDANLIQEYAVSKVHNSDKESQKNLANHMCDSKGTAKLCQING